MIGRGEVEKCICSSTEDQKSTEALLSIKTISGKIKIFFDTTQNAFEKEFKKFTIGDHVVFHYSSASIITESTNNSLPDTTLSPNATQIGASANLKKIIKLNFSKDVKIGKDPYKCIADIKTDKYSDVVAMCTKFKPLISTKGTDSLFSLDLIDQTGFIEVKVFTTAKEFGEFGSDEPFKIGDILLIRNMKRSVRGNVAIVNKPCLINKIYNFIDLVSDQNTKNIKNSTLKDTNGFAERAIAQLLNNEIRSVKLSKSMASSKTLMIKDLKDQSFFNIIGKVISCDYGTIPTVCIVDYTVNNEVTECSGTFPNSMVLVIKLFGQHAYLTDKITVGGYFYFLNIRVHSFSPALTAYMHDSLEGDVIPIAEEHVLPAIKERETDYQAKRRHIDNKTEITKNINTLRNEDIKAQVIKEVNDALEDIDIPGVKSINSDLTDKINESTCKSAVTTQNYTANINENFVTRKIQDISDPGIYLSTCFLTDIFHSPDINDLFSVLTVKEDNKEYKLITKRNLTKKMLVDSRICIGKTFKCLVLLVGTGDIYMIDIFAEDKEYQEFVSFYLNSLKKD